MMFFLAPKNLGVHVVYGYKPWEVGLTFHVPPADPSFRVTETNPVLELEQKIMCVSLGMHVDGAVNFWPDTSCQDGALLGVIKRIATEMPVAQPPLMEEFLAFSKKFIVDHMSECIIQPDEDITVETWLNGTNYPISRREELLKTWERYVAIEKKHLDVMCHVKHEPYVQKKYFRGIYSRSDMFKCYFGPVCALLGKRMFNLKWFCKYLNTSAKIARMRELFDNANIRVFTNDFTSFEATFVELLMEVELFFFEYMTQYLPIHKEMMEILKKIKKGDNKLRFRLFVALLRAKRYSGEMDTSLSNSLVNLCFMCFLLYKAGHPEEFYTIHFPPQVEGDDSLGAFIRSLDMDLLFKLGAKAKLEIFDRFNEASFCGVLFGDDSDCIIREPISTLLNFGYSGLRYLNSTHLCKMKLLRAKSLSLLYSYPGCPILRSLALYGLRVTTKVSNKYAIYRALNGESNTYERDRWRALLSADFNSLIRIGVSESARLMMEKKFCVDCDSQLILEKYLDSLSVLQPLYHPLILELAGQERIDHYDTHTERIKLERKSP